MGHLTKAEAAAMGIDGGQFLGTVILTDMMRANAGGSFSVGSEMVERDPALKAAIQKANAAELKRRLEKERNGTAELLMHVKLAGLPEPRSLLHPDGQLKFHPNRRWRFDLAWEDAKLAVELQGFGSHSSAKGLVLDTEKACEAAILGWMVLPMLYKHVRDGRAIRWITAAYSQRYNV